MNLSREDLEFNLKGIKERGKESKSTLEVDCYSNNANLETRYKMALRGLPLFAIDLGQMEIVNSQDWDYIHKIENLFRNGKELPNEIKLPSFPTEASFYMNVGAKSNDLSRLDYEQYDIGEKNKNWYRFGKKHNIKFNKDTIFDDLNKIYKVPVNYGSKHKLLSGFCSYLKGEVVNPSSTYEYAGYLCAEKGFDLEKFMKNSEEGRAPEIWHELQLEGKLKYNSYPRAKFKHDLEQYIPKRDELKQEFSKNFPLSKSALVSVTDEDREYIYSYVHRLAGTCQTCGTDKSFYLPSRTTKSDVYFQLRMAHAALVLNEGGVEVSEEIKYVAKLLFDMGIKDLTDVRNFQSFQSIVDNHSLFLQDSRVARYFSCGINELVDPSYTCDYGESRIDKEKMYLNFGRKAAKEKLSFEQIKEVIEKGWEAVSKNLYGENMPKASLREYLAENKDNESWLKEWNRGWKEGAKNYTSDKQWNWEKICNLSPFEMAKQLAESGNLYVNNEISVSMYNTQSINSNGFVTSGYMSKFVNVSIGLNRDYTEFMTEKQKNMYRWRMYTLKNSLGQHSDINGVFSINIPNDQALYFVYGFRHGLDGSYNSPTAAGFTGEDLRIRQECWDFGVKLAKSDFATVKNVTELINKWANSSSTESLMSFLNRNNRTEMKMANSGGGVKQWASNKASQWTPSLKTGSLKGLVRSLKTQVKQIIVKNLSKKKKNKTYLEGINDVMESAFGDMIVYTIIAELVKPVGNFVRLPENMTSFISDTCKEEIAAFVTESMANGAADLAGGLFTELMNHLQSTTSAFQVLEAGTKEEAASDNVIEFSNVDQEVKVPA